ncbi:hypothetical protein [Tomitella gaofuii]|uniref:hypothetical protein n=1 Tax=Tomitella gaofuii TaxID=2760083 RepID=UPI0015FC0880|nr:hypothetical protein [Tomitella gaofuii]
MHAPDGLADVPVVGAGPGKALAPDLALALVLAPNLALGLGLANRVLGRPGYFRFRSRYTLTVTDGGREHVRTGTTLHEMVALK